MKNPMTIEHEVYDILSKNGEMTAQDLRHSLNKDKWFWQKWRAVSFYGLMRELEEKGVVTQDFRNFLVNGVYPSICYKLKNR